MKEKIHSNFDLSKSIEKINEDIDEDVFSEGEIVCEAPFDLNSEDDVSNARD